MSETGDRITRIYGNFRGVDFRGEEINFKRSPDSLNVWKDYKETERIRTRPTMKPYADFDSRINGIYSFNGSLIIHAGECLYEVKNDESKVIYGENFETMSNAPSNGFIFDEKLYIKDDANYVHYDGENANPARVGAYTPTTSIGRSPSGGGTIYEDVNLLSNTRKNSFVGDGVSTEYHLDTTDLTSTAVNITVNGITGPEYQKSVDIKKGIVTFREAPSKPLTDGQDNVVIKFTKHVAGYRERILNCTLVQVFDNRVFFGGNPDYPNIIWHSSLNNPLYCSDLDYYEEGHDDALIKGIVAGNNALWVFREPSQENTSVFYHTPTIDSDYGKIYPSQHSSINTGCVGKAINFNDDIVFFSPRGMEGISGDVTTEQAVAHRSSLVDRKLISEKDYKKMILVEWQGYLIVFIGNKAYLADSRAVFTNTDHTEYEWFYWEMEHEISFAKVVDGRLYLCSDKSIYTLTGEDDLESYWVTPKDKFNAPNKLKTTNKRGCVVEAEGDIDVYAKVEDTDFELIGSFENVEDYFACRIKRKKFKDIQLKFHSNKRFSLETATLECFIGGYIKR
jgi:hypothetical protein